jgi:hypothetical protein
MVLGAMAVFIIDGRLRHAAAWAFAGAVLAYFGLIHGAQLGWAVSPMVALGYAMFGATCYLLAGRTQTQARPPRELIRRRTTRCGVAKRLPVARWSARRGQEAQAGYARKACSARRESDTQPNSAPCALTISSATRWNSGKYEPTQSESTTHS